MSINISCCCYEDKGDGTDAESGAQEDFLIQDEIFKSRLVSIKRVSHSVISVLHFAKVASAPLYMHPLLLSC
jgi:hypothetical protein